jgi:hypothetical protein
LIGKVQKALQISLTDLSRWSSGSILASPSFGAPQSPKVKFDVFVLMPFAENLRGVYEDHIKPVVSQVSLTVGRGDDFFTASSIMGEVWSSIYHSRIVIADCTGRNPNVFYEIGIAHTVGKPVVLLAQMIEDIPFDLRHIRTILYAYTLRGMKEFEESLKKVLHTLIESGASEGA